MQKKHQTTFTSIFRKMKQTIPIILLTVCSISCSDNKMDKKGFQVNEITEDENGKKIVGLKIDSLKFETRPVNVLNTSNFEH